MKDRLREMLERTCDTGELQSAMQQVLQQTQNIIPCDNKDLDDAKLKMRSLLEDSVENGRLESLLSKQLQKDLQPKSELEGSPVCLKCGVGGTAADQLAGLHPPDCMRVM